MPRSLPPGERKTTAWEPECRRAEDQAGVYCGDLLTPQGHAPRHLHWGGSHCRESLLCSKTAHPQQPQDRATIATGAFRSRPPSPTSCSSPGTEGSVTAPCPTPPVWPRARCLPVEPSEGLCLWESEQRHSPTSLLAAGGQDNLKSHTDNRTSPGPQAAVCCRAPHVLQSSP